MATQPPAHNKFMCGYCVMCGAFVFAKGVSVDILRRADVEHIVQLLAKARGIDQGMLKTMTERRFVACDENEDDPLGKKMRCTHLCARCCLPAVIEATKSTARAVCDHVPVDDEIKRSLVVVSTPKPGSDTGTVRQRRPVTVWSNRRAPRTAQFTRSGIALSRRRVNNEHTSSPRQMAQIDVTTNPRCTTFVSATLAASQRVGGSASHSRPGRTVHTIVSDLAEILRRVDDAISDWNKRFVGAPKHQYGPGDVEHFKKAIIDVYRHFANKTESWTCVAPAIRFSFFMRAMPCNHVLIRWVTRCLFMAYPVKTKRLTEIAHAATSNGKTKLEAFDNITRALVADGLAVLSAASFTMISRGAAWGVFTKETQSALLLTICRQGLLSKKAVIATETQFKRMCNHVHELVGMFASHKFIDIHGIPEMYYFKSANAEELAWGVLYTASKLDTNERNTTQLRMRDREVKESELWGTSKTTVSRLQVIMRAIKPFRAQVLQKQRDFLSGQVDA